MKIQKVLFGFLLTGALYSCDSVKETVTTTVDETVTNVTGETIDISYLNTNVKPQDDFFEFSNGTWVKNNPVPASESRWGSFNELEQANNSKLTSLLEEAVAAKAEKGSMHQILGDYYASYTNMDVRNQIGISPLETLLQEVKSVDDKSLAKTISMLHQLDISALFRFGVGQDLKDVDNHALYIGQGGIGLPNKNYYFDEDKKDILNKYVVFMSSSFQKVGYEKSEADNMSSLVVRFEKGLAETMMEPSELRVPENTYNKYSLHDATRLFGEVSFDEYYAMSRAVKVDSVVIGQPKFIENLQNVLKNQGSLALKAYLQWCVIKHYAGHLDQEFVELSFGFYGQTLSGKKEMKPINERAIAEITNAEFAELLGKAFVEKHYSLVAKNKVNEMVDNLLIIFQERIKNLDWMSDATKKEALVKLKSIGRKLGFPDHWEDFSKLSFTAEDYIGNINETARYSYTKNIEKLGQKVNKEEWGMPAHMVNAYYHPLLNEIAFPAGIMQPPFFSETYEDAVNYGRIGMVIGHEFTHGFDDMGSKFAADGSFTNWWTEDDRTRFEERTAKLGTTFAGFCPIEGHCVNPQLTMGENIADLGGLTMAYYAYARTAEFKSGIKKEGFDPAQRFFIAYAQLWKINYTDEELKNRIANDSHSPGMYRVNGPLMNCPEFFDAFGVKEGDAMRNSEEKISKIW